MATATSTIQQARRPPCEAGQELQTEQLPLEYQIRQRAHEIWLARDGSAVSELADRLEAEKEIAF